MMNDFITICIPVYKVESFVGRCVESLFNQTYDNIKYIFVDDSSPDNSMNIIREKMSSYPERAKNVTIIRHEKNMGIAAVRNTLLENCDTEYMMWVDSDDYIEKTAVEKCMSQVSEHKYDIVFFDSASVWPKYIDRTYNPHIYEPRELLKGMFTNSLPPCLWGTIIRRELFTSHGIGFYEGENMAEDLQAMLRATYYVKSVSYIDDCLYYYNRTSETAATYDYSEAKCEMMWKTFLRLGNAFEHDNECMSWLQDFKLHLLCSMVIVYSHSVHPDNYYYQTLRPRYEDIYNKTHNKAVIEKAVYLLRNRKILAFIVKTYIAISDLVTANKTK